MKEKRKQYYVALIGCDDNTELVTWLTDNDLEALQSLAVSVNGRSEDRCQPTFIVREATNTDIERDNEYLENKALGMM